MAESVNPHGNLLSPLYYIKGIEKNNNRVS